MADFISTQDLINVKQDIEDIGLSVNTDGIITPRYGAAYDSLPKVIREMIEQKNLKLAELQTAIDTAVAAGVGAAGWYSYLVVHDNGETQKQINDYIGATWYARVGGYQINDKARLANGEFVVSTIANNVNNPNIDMNGWVKTNKFFVESIADLLAIQNPKTGQTIITLSYVAGLNKGGAKYTYDATRAAENNGVTCINGWVKNNTSRLLASQAGCREGDFDNTDQLNALILAASSEGIKEVILDGFYKIGKLELGTTTTPFGDEQMWWLLKARSNVTVSGRSWSDGLFIAGGLVASNAALANTKGYCVFGDYNQANVENFKINNFLIDNNGKNNLLQPVNAFGSQSLCPNVWFQRGKNIGVFDIHFKDNPGHQTVVLDSGVKGAKVIGNTFTDNGKGLDGNVNIIDHSSIYCRATDFKISGNTLKFTTAKPDLSTALEIHGVDGHVHSNTVEGYPFPLIRASFFGQVSKNVLVYSNIFNDCNYGVNLDGGANSPLYVDVYDNKFNFRAEKPADGRLQVAVGHTQAGGFVAVTPASTHDIIINIHNNEFTQPPPVGGWTIYNEFDNCLWDGGKCTEVNFKNNTFKGFKGGYRINYLNGLAKYTFNDTLINCGSQVTQSKSLITYQNVDGAWTVPVTSVNADSELIYCLYDYQIHFVSDVTPKTGIIKGSSTNWIAPYEGSNPDSSTYFGFEYSVRSVDPNKILYSQSLKVFGKITLPNDQYFYKQNGYAGRWNMHRTLPVFPTSPRFFGDIKGDRVDILQPNAGTYASFVCTVSGADVNTVGIWKGYGVIQA